MIIQTGSHAEFLLPALRILCQQPERGDTRHAPLLVLQQQASLCKAWFLYMWYHMLLSFSSPEVYLHSYRPIYGGTYIPT